MLAHPRRGDPSLLAPTRHLEALVHIVQRWQCSYGEEAKHPKPPGLSLVVAITAEIPCVPA